MPMPPSISTQLSARVAPVWADTGSTGAPARGVPAVSAAMFCVYRVVRPESRNAETVRPGMAATRYSRASCAALPLSPAAPAAPTPAPAAPAPAKK